MIYSNFNTMTRDIVGFIRATGMTIFVHDDPMDGYMGFCTGADADVPLEVRWQYHVLDLAKITDPVIRGAIQTTAGRASLLEAMRRTAQDDTITDPDYIKHMLETWHGLMDRAPRSPAGGWTIEIPPGQDGRQ